MNLKKFEEMTNEERKDSLNNLVGSKGWKLLEFWIQYEDIDAMESTLLNGEEDQTLDDIKLLRANMKFAKMLLNRPYELIEDLTYEIEQDENPELKN